MSSLPSDIEARPSYAGVESALGASCLSSVQMLVRPGQLLSGPEGPGPALGRSVGELPRLRSRAITAQPHAAFPSEILRPEVEDPPNRRCHELRFNTDPGGNVTA